MDAGEDRARAVLGEPWRTPAFRQFLAASAQGSVRTDFPVAVLSVSIADALGAESRIVRLSSETAAKQAVRHPDIDPGDYANIQHILDGGELFRDGDRWVTGFAEVEGRLWRAVVKATRNGSEIYAVSLHRATEHKLRSAQRRLDRLGGLSIV